MLLVGEKILTLSKRFKDAKKTLNLHLKFLISEISYL